MLLILVLVALVCIYLACSLFVVSQAKKTLEANYERTRKLVAKIDAEKEELKAELKTLNDKLVKSAKKEKTIVVKPVVKKLPVKKLPVKKVAKKVTKK